MRPFPGYIVRMVKRGEVTVAAVDGAATHEAGTLYCAGHVVSIPDQQIPLIIKGVDPNMPVI